MKNIDLNCDLGEDPQAIRDGTDAALMASISSANIACGGHAGDPWSMEESVRSALRHGVALGAHPGYPDRERFGRVALTSTAEEIERFVHEQVRALAAVASRVGARLAHVKPHGALYHAAMQDLSVAEAFARGVVRVEHDLVLYGLAGSPTLDLWRGLGLPVAREAFADRRYERDGSLRSRTHADALILEPDGAAEQSLAIARGEGVRSWEGTPVGVEADSICIHGDTPGATAILREVRARLENAGFRIGRVENATRRA